MKPVRQIEVAALMVSARKFSARFVKALLDGTRDELLVVTNKGSVRNITPAHKSLMEQETDEMLKNVQSIQDSYGRDVLNFTAACGYIERLLANLRVRRYLTKHHKDTLTALENLLSETAADKQRRPPSKQLTRARVRSVR